MWIDLDGHDALMPGEKSTVVPRDADDGGCM